VSWTANPFADTITLGGRESSLREGSAIEQAEK